MLLKYRPEDKTQKKERLLKRAQEEAEGKSHDAKKPIVVKYGLNHVTYLIEQVIFYSIHLKYFTIMQSDTLLLFLTSIYYYFIFRTRHNWL